MRREMLLGEADQVDHALVRFAGGGAEAEDAVLEQHHAERAGAGLAGKGARSQPREIETRHDVGQDDHRVAVDLPHAALAAGAVGDRHHRIGMGVVDVLERQRGVQQRFDRGRRGIGARALAQQGVDHLGIAQALERGQSPQGRQAERGEAGGRDRLEVPAAPLDVQDLLLLAEQVPRARLDRGVAAAVQHQRAVPPEQPRRVHALAEVAGKRRGFAVAPQASHSETRA
jgi:hypothetical protein